MSRAVMALRGTLVARCVVPVDHCGYMRHESDVLVATRREVGAKPRRSLGQELAGAP
jgi:hypothetical protein